MHTTRVASGSKRTGFTLVEILVVAAIALILAVIVVAFSPKILERERAAQGADQLQGALLVAKQRAQRDRLPTGLRIQPLDIRVPVGFPLAQLAPNSPLSVCRPSVRFGVTENAWPWAISVGSQVMVFNPDPLNPNDPYRYFNLEIVQVVAVDVAGFQPPNFVAQFSKPHPVIAGGFYIKPLAYATDLQLIQVPPEIAIGPAETAGSPSNSIRALSRQDGASSKAPGPGFALQLARLPPLPVQTGMPTPNPNTRDFTANYGIYTGTPLGDVENEKALWTVQPGDYIELNDSEVRRIELVTYTDNSSQQYPAPLSGPSTIQSPPPGVAPGAKEGDVLILANATTLLGPGATAAKYRIIRGPRLISGEQPIQLPHDVAIDLSAGLTGRVAKEITTHQNPNVISTFEPLPIDNYSGSIDIIFSPQGQIVSRGAGNKIVLWVRNPTQDLATPGNQTLVAIYARTGMVGTHPVDTSPGLLPPPNGPLYGDPFNFTRTGRVSGI